MTDLAGRPLAASDDALISRSMTTADPRDVQVISGIPPLAGAATWEQATRPGLSVDESVRRLKFLHYTLKRLHEIWTSRITSEPVYELKTAFSRHAYLAAEHVTAIRNRVGEMREPPLGLEEVPDPALQFLFDEIRAAPTCVELSHGLYGVVVPELLRGVEEYLEQTNWLADAPSVRVLRYLAFEFEEIRQFGETALLTMTSEGGESSEWMTLLTNAISAAGGVVGTRPAVDATVLSPRYSDRPWKYDPMPRRDARFQDSYNAGVNPEAFLYDPRFSPRDKTLMMFYKRLREIDVPEMMASILAETHGRPWGFYHDMSRQLWDEARHAMMGEVGFRSIGIDWTQIPINFTWSLNLNTQLTAQERHAVLFFIEQGLMPRTGKRYEWEVGQASGNALSATFQDFDWADEVLHASIGREWYVSGFPSLKDALNYGDRCWSQVMSHWSEYRDQGLTEHRNWWPELYQDACRQWGVDPDPAALAFCQTYETVRADLKTISASG
jgi:hypothetical protein